MDLVTRSDAIQATLLTAFGALMLFGAFPFPLDAPLVGVGLIVLAVLVFTRTLNGPMWLGAVLLALALVMLVANPIGRFIDQVLATSIQVIVGGLLIALGVLKLATPDDWPEGDPAPTSAVSPTPPMAAVRDAANTHHDMHGEPSPA